MNNERKLARVVAIDSISPVENSDNLECAHVGGWDIVIRKGEFKEGEKCVFCEIDSWIPTELAPFLSKGKSPRAYQGILGERLRTVKLRGQISQGLLLNLSVLPDNEWPVDEDVSTILNIVKWEAPIPECLRGKIKGNFPDFIPKTDQERIQNLTKELDSHRDERFEVSIKLDGSSITVYSRDGEDGVCSRNLNLKKPEDGETEDNYWKIALQLDLHNKIKSTGRNLAIQGEMLSPKIQGNWERVSYLEMFVYDIYDIDNKCYLSPNERQWLCIELEIPHVPILGNTVIGDTDVRTIIDSASGNGMNDGVMREGLVYKSYDSDFSFKAISQEYLMKNKNA